MFSQSTLWKVYNSLNKLKKLSKPTRKPENKGKVIKVLNKLKKNIG
jgi:hypothetical protein